MCTVLPVQPQVDKCCSLRSLLKATRHELSLCWQFGPAASPGIPASLPTIGHSRKACSLWQYASCRCCCCWCCCWGSLLLLLLLCCLVC